jgi:hypothetical protein
MGTTIRTKAEAIVTELAFIDGNEDLAYRLLEEAVYYVGYTKLTLLSLILGYLYPTTGLGRYLPTGHWLTIHLYGV